MERLTNSQKSIWVTEQFYKGSSVNTICGSAIIEERVDFQKLEEAIKIVIKKHAYFKLQFKIKNGEIKQELSEPKEAKITTINVASEKELEKYRKSIVIIPFNFEKSQLFNFYIFKFENGNGAFMLNIHHIISDAWTLALICNDIIRTYYALKNNENVETKSMYSYVDYINSEKEYHKGDKRFKADKDRKENRKCTINRSNRIFGCTYIRTTNIRKCK